MTGASRRSFLKGLATCFVAAALPLSVAFAHQRDRLRLWGDGIHDDAPAIQALVDHAARVGVMHAWLPSGEYLLNSTVTFDERHSFMQVHSPGDGAVLLRGEGLVDDDPMILFRGKAQGVNVRPSILVDSRPSPLAGPKACL